MKTQSFETSIIFYHSTNVNFQKPSIFHNAAVRTRNLARICSLSLIYDKKQWCHIIQCFVGAVNGRFTEAWLFEIDKFSLKFILLLHFCMMQLSRSRWRYSPGWALASATIFLQVSRFFVLSLRSFIPIFFRSMDTSSSHLILGLPLRLVAYSFPYSVFFWDCGVLHVIGV